MLQGSELAGEEGEASNARGSFSFRRAEVCPIPGKYVCRVGIGGRDMDKTQGSSQSHWDHRKRLA